MKKKSIIFLSVIFLLIIGIYFGLKGFALYYSKTGFDEESYQKLMKGFSTQKNLSLKTTKLADNQYLDCDGFKIKNEFQEFTKLENPNNITNFSRYVLYNSDHSVKAGVFIGADVSYLENFKNEADLYGTGSQIQKLANLTALFEKNDVHNDLDLFAYLVKTKDHKDNIFTSFKKMNENHSLRLMTSIIFPTIDSITLIEGDYQGYIFHIGNQTKEVSFLKNDKRYIITFINGDYFTDQYVEQLLQTVVIP